MDTRAAIVAIFIGLCIGIVFFRPNETVDDSEKKEVRVEFVGSNETRYHFKNIDAPSLAEEKFSEKAEYVALELEKKMELEHVLKLTHEQNYKMRLYLEQNLQIEKKLDLERKLDLVKDLELEKRLQLEHKIYLEFVELSKIKSMDLEKDYDLYVFPEEEGR